MLLESKPPALVSWRQSLNIFIGVAVDINHCGMLGDVGFS